MSRLLTRWLVLTLTIWMLPSFLGGIRVEGFGAAIAAAAILGILNTVLRPVLILFTLPLTILSLGLFIFVINALVFQFAGALVHGFQVSGFGSALLGSLVVSLVSWIIDLSVRRQDGQIRFEVRKGQSSRRVIDLESRGSRWE